MCSPEHFRVLDALRGICALLVCLFHMEVNSHIYDLWFVQNAWLFVDFFFVLSGFVIAANYQDRLLSGFSIGRFMWLRFGRLYPLHLFVLLLMIAFELFKAELGGVLGDPKQGAFTGDKSPESILTNALLLQSLWADDRLYWNGPAWSISAEFWAYLVFAVTCALGPRVVQAVAIVIFVAVPAWIILSKGGSLNVSHDGGVLRCLLGFAVGVGCWRIWVSGRFPKALLGRLEVPVLALVIAFVASAKHFPITIVAPFVFGCATLVFAAQLGRMSRALDRPFWGLMGLLSYSIYMIHVFVILRMENLCRVLEMKFRISVLGSVSNPNNPERTLLGASPLVGDAIVLVTVALVIGISWCTYHWIERPGRDWARRPVSASQE